MLCISHAFQEMCHKEIFEIIIECKILPEVNVFLNGKLLNDVTLLLSADNATDGNKHGVGVSECDRSCIARPPAPGA